MSRRRTNRRAFAAMTTIVIAEANARRVSDQLQDAIDDGVQDAMIGAQVEFFGSVSAVMI